MFRIDRLCGAACALLLMMPAPPALAASSNAFNPTQNPACQQVALPADGDYGGKGPYGYAEEHLPSPLWPQKDVVVVRPANLNRPAPVLFYSHAYGETEYRYYLEMFRHFASRGYAVVYSPYQKHGVDTQKRYDTLWAGFEAAVARFGNVMDVSRMGFIGHSFGGGATPAIAYRALTQKGWGNRAAFMFMMAPWYSYVITPDALKNFPRHVRLVMQVYDRDNTNDHRMAIDIFRNIGLPDAQKNFIRINSQSRQNCDLIADHAMPRDDAPAPLRYYGIYRLVDALAALTIDGQSAAAGIALGNGSKQQVYMGKWPDGLDIAYSTVSAAPAPFQPESYYKFPWSNPLNPRR